MKLVAGFAALVLAQAPQATPMPYIAIHRPEFVEAREAAFLRDDPRATVLVRLVSVPPGDQGLHSLKFRLRLAASAGQGES
jgi:hypothetical protein